MPGPRPLALVVILAAASAACSGSDSARAGTTDGQPKQVTVVPVKRDSVRRAVDVVGTLTAVDQVTVSSEADGTVRAILADLGDRVQTGQVLVRLDNERQQYAFQQQQAALARTLAQYGATDPQHLPGTRKYARRAARERRARAGAQRVRPRAKSSSSESSSRSRPSTTPRPSCRPSRPVMKSRCRTPGI